MPFAAECGSTYYFITVYGSEVSIDSLSKEIRRERPREYRREALRIVSTCRTVSEPAVVVKIRVIPIVLYAAEQKEIKKPSHVKWKPRKENRGVDGRI